MSPAETLPLLEAEVDRLRQAGVRDEAAVWLCAAAWVRQQQDRTSGPWPRPREHGTERGYQQHRYDKTPACDACLAAHAQDHRRTA